jgi:thiosulfate dehydrogenase
MRPTLLSRVLPLVLILAAACRDDGSAARATVAAKRDPAAVGAAAVPIRPYVDSEVPPGAMGSAIRRGLALVEHTPDSLPGYVGGNLRCTSCHLDRGLRANAAPLAGAFAHYPRFVDRSGAVVPIEDRVNYCFTRSLAGRALPVQSTEMRDIVAYLAFASRGVPVGGRVKGEGMPKMPALAADSGRGRAVFVARCARCHGTDGAGSSAYPAVWGARSYSIGASMARLERAASFIRHNMPYDSAGVLGDQQAYDVAAYVNAHARPDLPGKAGDWPHGGAPADVPYATAGHAPFMPPPLLPRRHPDGASVPVPTPARQRGER